MYINKNKNKPLVQPPVSVCKDHSAVSHMVNIMRPIAISFSGLPHIAERTPINSLCQLLKPLDHHRA